MAYGIGSLFYMLLRTQGENPLQHPVKGELDRIKGYVQKAQKVKERALSVKVVASGQGSTTTMGEG